MKAKKTVTAAVSLIMVFCLSIGAFASNWEDFTDISGHWAEAALKKAFDDGLITGLSGTELAPDSPITAAQMITILCRVLGAAEKSDVSPLGFDPDVWYADAASKALKLGLISAEAVDLDAPMSRQDALSMMAKAFCLVPAEPDYAVLDSYSDAAVISDKNRGAMAALVSDKLIQGFDGALDIDGSISRAEFTTVLYRVADRYAAVGSVGSGAQSNYVIKGGGFLSYVTVGNVWFDCSAESVALSGISADSVTLRSHRLTSFQLGGGSELSRLTVAVGTGSVYLDSFGGSKIGTLRLESCTSASVDSCAGTVEVTGNGIPVSIAGRHDYLIVTGSNNVITLSSGASLSRLKISGENNTVKLADGAFAGTVSCGEIELLGSGNSVSFVTSSDVSCKVTVGGSENKLSCAFGAVASLNISGTKAEVDIGSLSEIPVFSVTGNENDVKISGSGDYSPAVTGSLNEIAAKSGGALGSVEISGNSNWLSLSCAELSAVSILGSYNTVNKLEAGTVASLSIPGTGNVFVLSGQSVLTAAEANGPGNTLTVNGAAGTVTLSGRKTVLNGSGKVTNLNINASGCTVTLTAETVTDNSGQAEEDRVLKLVTQGYAGNYTLKWAQEHDYESSEKEVWVNAKDYTSATDYLIWVNLSMQRVNIFKGGEGNWILIYSCIVGTGAPGRGTPVGVWKTTYKAWAGWTTSTYTVKPVIGFKEKTGYAFHSRLYYPGTDKLSDYSIGFPVSHGCVRMYDEDVLYIYNNIPLGTTVVVY